MQRVSDTKISMDHSTYTLPSLRIVPCVFSMVTERGDWCQFLKLLYESRENIGPSTDAVSQIISYCVAAKVMDNPFFYTDTLPRPNILQAEVDDIVEPFRLMGDAGHSIIANAVNHMLKCKKSDSHKLQLLVYYLPLVKRLDSIGAERCRALLRQTVSELSLISAQSVSVFPVRG